MEEKFEALVNRKKVEIWNDYRAEKFAAVDRRNERLAKVDALVEIGRAMDERLASLDIVCPPEEMVTPLFEAGLVTKEKIAIEEDAHPAIYELDIYLNCPQCKERIGFRVSYREGEWHTVATFGGTGEKSIYHKGTEG